MTRINAADLSLMPQAEQDRKKRTIDEMMAVVNEKSTLLALPMPEELPDGFVDPYEDMPVQAEHTRNAIQRIVDTIEKSTTDTLTGLPNRRAFMTALPNAVERANKTGKNIYLVMMDLDFFKQVNDRYGHLAGDAVLKQLAVLLKRLSGTQPFRWGGEEFALILDGENDESIGKFCEDLREAIERYEFVLPDGTVLRRTVSIGYGSVALNAGVLGVENPVSDDVEKTDEQKQAEMVLNLVDKALYAAKAGGRNSVIKVGEQKYIDYVSNRKSPEQIKELEYKNAVLQDNSTGNQPGNQV